MTDEGPIEVRVFTSAGFGQNAYLVRAPESRRAVAVDPSGAVGAMVARERRKNVQIPW